jgi:hypothetical protein
MLTIAPSMANKSSSLWDCDDLVGLLCYFDLSKHEALARRKGRDHMDRGLAPFFW